MGIASILLAGGMTSPAQAEERPELPVGIFSSAAAGEGPPPGWKPLTFPKIPRQTTYALVKDGGTTVVRAAGRGSASGLTREVGVDLREYPILQWRWKVSNILRKSDVRRKEGDDYPARLYIAFEYDPKKVSLSRRAKYRIGRLFRDDIPIGALTYIWESRIPVGSVVDNAYTDFVKMIVVESGEAHVGKWRTEERNVYEDYVRAFGEEPPRVQGVAIMTDTDNTGEAAVAYYGDIVFRKK
ncbi:MAG: DUF3047 domain-containing protein [Nitrospirae bacterium]|nr:DUF3047 domain-containing protein [Nitrospirota bacterium]